MQDYDLYYGTIEEHELECLRELVILSLQANDMIKSPSGTWCKRPHPPRKN